MSEEFEYMDESLEVSQSQELSKIEENPESLQLKKDIKEDFQYARKNIKTIIDTGMNAVDNLALLASQTESPRVYECLSNLLQINSLNNSMLLDIDAKFKDLAEGKEDRDNDVDITNNTLIVATTTDIQRMIEEKIKGSK